MTAPSNARPVRMKRLAPTVPAWIIHHCWQSRHTNHRPVEPVVPIFTHMAGGIRRPSTGNGATRPASAWMSYLTAASAKASIADVNSSREYHRRTESRSGHGANVSSLRIVVESVSISCHRCWYTASSDR
jgi:hypothetical protein